MKTNRHSLEAKVNGKFTKVFLYLYFFKGWQSQAIVRFETGERHDQEGIVKIILNDLQTKTMSKTGQGILVSKNEEHPVHEAYHLTGRAGSFLYMAPEVIMCQPYNEKVSVN